MKQKPPPPSVLGSLGALIGSGFTVAVPLAAGAYAGNYLDSLYHTGSLFLLLGLLLGLTAGIYGAYRLFKIFFKF